MIIGLLLALPFAGQSADEELPYRIEDGVVDRKTFTGWRIFHSTCHGCHGVDATGTSVAPDLVDGVSELTARDFTVKVWSRYRLTVSAEAAGSDDKFELRANPAGSPEARAWRRPYAGLGVGHERQTPCARYLRLPSGEGRWRSGAGRPERKQQSR